MTQEAANQIVSLPDDLNEPKQLEFKLSGDEEDYLNSNEDKLNKRSSSQKVNQKPKLQKISLNHNETGYSPLELCSRSIQSSNKKLDSDSDSGLCSATEEVCCQQNDSNLADKFNQELINKAQEINEKTLLKLKSDETLAATNTLVHNLPASSHKPKSYRSLSIIGKRASNRMLKMNFHRTSIGSIQNQHSQSDDTSGMNDFSEFSKSIRFEMPSLTEINEVSNNTLTNLNSIDSFNDTNIQTENILINTNNIANTLNVPSSSSEMNANKSPSSANILTSLEYLMNNSNKFNTTVAIANIAAAASAAENNLITSDTETVLQNFFMDLVIPNVDQTSNNNLNINNNITNDNELSLIYQQHLIDNTANYLNSSNPNGDLNSTSGLPESSSTFNLATLNANKQTNDQIMRTCMGYLDYINKKHNKERRTQIIRNKISGFVLLTLVFLMVFGLAMVMVFCLTNALAKILLTHSSTRAPFRTPSFVNNKTVLLANGSVTNYSISRLKIEDANLMVNNIKLEPLVKEEIRSFIINLLDILIKSGLNLTQQNLTVVEESLFNMTAFTLLKYIEDDNNAPTEVRYYRFIDEIN